MVTSICLSGVCQRAERQTSFPLQCQSCLWLSVCCWAPVPCWWKRRALRCLVCASSMISWCSAASRSSCKCLYAHYSRLLADVNYCWLAWLHGALGVTVLIFLHSACMTTWRHRYQIVSLFPNCLWLVDQVLRSSFSFRFEIAIISNHFWCAVYRSGSRMLSVSVYNGIFHGMFMENSTVAEASEQPCAFNLQPKAETVPSVTNTYSSHAVGSHSADTH